MVLSYCEIEQYHLELGSDANLLLNMQLCVVLK